MRLFNPNRLNVIFLAPVAVVAAQGNGCSTGPESVGLTSDQVQEVIVGNTVTTGEQDAFAFVSADGTLRGTNLPSGGTTGEWRVEEDGTLCALWLDQPDTVERCDIVLSLGDNKLQWSGNDLLLVEGNPQNL